MSGGPDGFSAPRALQLLPALLHVTADMGTHVLDAAQVVPTVGVEGEDGERKLRAQLRHFRHLLDCEGASKAAFQRLWGRAGSRGSGADADRADPVPNPDLAPDSDLDPKADQTSVSAVTASDSVPTAAAGSGRSQALDCPSELNADESEGNGADSDCGKAEVAAAAAAEEDDEAVSISSDDSAPAAHAASTNPSTCRAAAAVAANADAKASAVADPDADADAYSLKQDLVAAGGGGAGGLCGAGGGIVAQPPGEADDDSGAGPGPRSVALKQLQGVLGGGLTTAAAEALLAAAGGDVARALNAHFEVAAAGLLPRGLSARAPGTSPGGAGVAALNAGSRQGGAEPDRAGSGRLKSPRGRQDGEAGGSGAGAPGGKRKAAAPAAVAKGGGKGGGGKKAKTDASQRAITSFFASSPRAVVPAVKAEPGVATDEHRQPPGGNSASMVAAEADAKPAPRSADGLLGLQTLDPASAADPGIKVERIPAAVADSGRKVEHGVHACALPTTTAAAEPGSLKGGGGPGNGKGSDTKAGQGAPHDAEGMPAGDVGARAAENEAVAAPPAPEPRQAPRLRPAKLAPLPAARKTRRGAQPRPAAPAGGSAPAGRGTSAQAPLANGGSGTPEQAQSPDGGSGRDGGGAPAAVEPAQPAQQGGEEGQISDATRRPSSDAVANTTGDIASAGCKPEPPEPQVSDPVAEWFLGRRAAAAAKAPGAGGKLEAAKAEPVVEEGTGRPGGTAAKAQSGAQMGFVAAAAGAAADVLQAWAPGEPAPYLHVARTLRVRRPALV